MVGGFSVPRLLCYPYPPLLPWVFSHFSGSPVLAWRIRLGA